MIQYTILYINSLLNIVAVMEISLCRDVDDDIAWKTVAYLFILFVCLFEFIIFIVL